MIAAVFSPLLSVGELMIGAALVALFGLGTFRTREVGRWRELYMLADTERKELSGELAEAREVLAEQSAQIAKLDALQMPVRVVESLRESSQAAAERQGQILETFKQHEERAQSRHDATLRVLGLIAERLGPEANGASS